MSETGPDTCYICPHPGLRCALALSVWQLHGGCCDDRRLDEDAASGKHGNCAEVLAAIARSRSSPLTSQLCEPARLEGLMKRAIVPPPDTPSVQVRSKSCRHMTLVLSPCHPRLWLRYATIFVGTRGLSCHL